MPTCFRPAICQSRSGRVSTGLEDLCCWLEVHLCCEHMVPCGQPHRASSRHYTCFHVAAAAAASVCSLQPRQRLDMYIPKSASKGDTLPTVVFVTGGAWTIGYKAWGALLARRLCDAGVITMCLDYRNFPQVTPAQHSTAGHARFSSSSLGSCEHCADAGRPHNICASAGLGHAGNSVKQQQCEECLTGIGHKCLRMSVLGACSGSA